MAYDPKKELKRVTDYYNQDPLQNRFSAIVSGDTGAGKSYLLRSCRFPIHIDSFDPGGTKPLRDLIRSESNPNGQIVADTRWENEDPFDPTAYKLWERETEVRLRTNYFDMFGTYCLDSLSTFGDAIMNYVLKGAGREGEVPMHRRDYNPQKTHVVNKIKRLMGLKCDFLIMAHLRELEDSKVDSKGNILKTYRYRLNITGNAVVTVPLLFDELYVLKGKGSPVKRELITDAQGTYIARSRLNNLGKIKSMVDPDIKKLLKSAGLKWEDKPKL